jgi:hypothetical protein
MHALAAPSKAIGRVDEHGLLLEYTLKLLLLAALLELILYRLVSRLGMHFSKVAAQYESVRLFFKGVSSIGFTLLNVVSLLVFLAIGLLLFNRWKAGGRSGGLLIPAMSLLLLLTVAFLVVPPAMLGSLIYNIVAAVALAILAAEYLAEHRRPSQRVMMLCYLLGVFGWLYYQTMSTAYGFFQVVAVPPGVHEINRAGEAMMVLASMAALWAYGGVSARTKNIRQRRRAVILALAAGVTFAGFLFLDYLLGLYDQALAQQARKAGEGIGWIFQMGMGYTFYLPFAFYLAGLLCWSYTVVKQVSMGRMAGYGLALMFMAGYALQLSHLTLMTMLGLMLLNQEQRVVPVHHAAAEPSMTASGPIISHRMF